MTEENYHGRHLGILMIIAAETIKPIVLIDRR